MQPPEGPRPFRPGIAERRAFRQQQAAGMTAEQRREKLLADNAKKLEALTATLAQERLQRVEMINSKLREYFGRIAEIPLTAPADEQLQSLNRTLDKLLEINKKLLADQQGLQKEHEELHCRFVELRAVLCRLKAVAAVPMSDNTGLVATVYEAGRRYGNISHLPPKPQRFVE